MYSHNSKKGSTETISLYKHKTLSLDQLNFRIIIDKEVE